MASNHLKPAWELDPAIGSDLTVQHGARSGPWTRAPEHHADVLIMVSLSLTVHMCTYVYIHTCLLLYPSVALQSLYAF